MPIINKMRPTIKTVTIFLVFAIALALQGCSGSNKWAVPDAAFNISPIAVITSPLDGSEYGIGLLITFTGSGEDTEDGALSGGSLVWTSDKDGQIGTGMTFDITSLSENTHVITLTATDASGATGTTSITITVRTPWFNPQWGYRQQITVSASMASLDQTDFPALIQITDQANPLFGRARSDGFDILFTEDDGVTQLDHEIELYRDAGTEELDAWVRIPNLSSSSDTILYMYYGYLGAGNQENVNSVWDSNFLMVQHLEETSGTLFDSTTNSNDGAPQGAVECNISGKINGDCNFDAGSERVRIDMSLGSTVTIDAWAQLDTQGDMLWTIDTDSTGPDLWFTNNNIYLNTWDGWNNPFCSQPANVNQWHHYVAIIEPGNTVLYVDGVLCGTANYRNPTETVIFIGSSSTSYTWDGRVDEVRISNIARSADWIQTSFNNQDNPAGFLTFNVEETY